MKIAVCADLHAHNYTKYANVDTDGANSRLNWILKAIREIARVSKENHADALVIAGDVFHSRKAIDITVLDSVYQELISIKDLPMYLITGNHDIYEGGGKISVKIFSKFMKVIRKPRTINIAGTVIGCLPWVSNKKTISSAVKVFKDDGVKYVIGHLGISGAVTGEQNYALSEGSEPALFRSFKWVALGHYHKHQTLGNISYVGSPLQHTWGETGEKKGFMIFDETGGEFIELKGFPRFIKVTASNQPDDISEIDYVKITGKQEEIQNIKLPEGVKRIEVAERQIDDKPRIVFNDETYAGILNKYVELHEQAQVDQKFLVGVGLTYLKG